MVHSQESLLSGHSHHYGTMKSDSSDDHSDQTHGDELAVGALPTPPADAKANGGLHRGLSARQVQMIAIAGTIGTGLFLGTGRSLAQGGPASMLICYAVIGFIVYVTLLLLGEMSTQYPVAGEFLLPRCFACSGCPWHFERLNIHMASPRILQCLCNSFLLAIIRFRAIVELLV